MSQLKFTKTATFLFPLLDIPKSLFECNIKMYSDVLKLITGL